MVVYIIGMNHPFYDFHIIEKFSFITILRNGLFCLVFLQSYCKKDIGFFTQLMCCEIKDDFQIIAKFSFVTFDVRTIKMSKGWRKSIGSLTLETIVCACKVLMIDSNCFYNHNNKVFSMQCVDKIIYFLILFIHSITVLD